MSSYRLKWESISSTKIACSYAIVYKVYYPIYLNFICVRAISLHVNLSGKTALVCNFTHFYITIPRIYPVCRTHLENRKEKHVNKIRANTENVKTYDIINLTRVTRYKAYHTYQFCLVYTTGHCLGIRVGPIPTRQEK